MLRAIAQFFRREEDPTSIAVELCCDPQPVTFHWAVPGEARRVEYGTSLVRASTSAHASAHGSEAQRLVGELLEDHAVEADVRPFPGWRS